jgi:acyl-CoA synthetase (AMP-forming)/AMP-acid ligase II
MTPGAGSLYDELAARALRQPRLPAILAPDRRTLTFERLKRQIDDSVHRLRAFGIRRNDRVALVLPNGPEATVALIAVASCASSAPLNPAYRATELRSYLRDLKPAAIIRQDAMHSATGEVAEEWYPGYPPFSRDSPRSRPFRSRRSRLVSGRGRRFRSA